MTNTKPASVTIEEAVARMVNMDYIYEGHSLLEMLDFFREEAEVEYENALSDVESQEEIKRKRLRLEACATRVSLAETLMDSLAHEMRNIDQSVIILAEDSTSQKRLTIDSVADWAVDKYGIWIPEWFVSDPKSMAPEGTCWEDVSIKLRANDRMAVSYGDSVYKEFSYQWVGLTDGRGNTPNKSAIVLHGLSKEMDSEGNFLEGKKYPPSPKPKPSESTAMSKLRKLLHEMTGIMEDPFLPINDTDGWKPKFELIDDRKNADYRKERDALRRNNSFDEQMHSKGASSGKTKKKREDY